MYDYDKVELANMNRLFFRPEQVPSFCLPHPSPSTLTLIPLATSLFFTSNHFWLLNESSTLLYAL